MTLLSVRPLSVKLKIAYMACEDLYTNHLPRGSAGSTLERYAAEGKHFYIAMWEHIAKWDENALCGCQNLTDREINDRFKVLLTKSPKLRRVVKHWNDQGWTAYEEKRAGKSKWAVKGAFVVGMAVLTGNVPSFD